jgi:hypothetical protein
VSDVCCIDTFFNCRAASFKLWNLCSSYEYWDPNDCDNDENCQLPPEQRTNPAVAMAFLRRFYWVLGVSISSTLCTALALTTMLVDVSQLFCYRIWRQQLAALLIRHGQIF